MHMLTANNIIDTHTHKHTHIHASAHHSCLIMLSEHVVALTIKNKVETWYHSGTSACQKRVAMTMKSICIHRRRLAASMYIHVWTCNTNVRVYTLSRASLLKLKSLRERSNKMRVSLRCAFIVHMVGYAVCLCMRVYRCVCLCVCVCVLVQ
jgi:hypothetical protein